MHPLLIKHYEEIRTAVNQRVRHPILADEVFTIVLQRLSANTDLSQINNISAYAKAEASRAVATTTRFKAQNQTTYLNTEQHTPLITHNNTQPPPTTNYEYLTQLSPQQSAILTALISYKNKDHAQIFIDYQLQLKKGESHELAINYLANKYTYPYNHIARIIRKVKKHIKTTLNP